MSDYMFKIKTNINSEHIAVIDSYISCLANVGVIKCENELIGIGRPYSEYIFHMSGIESEKEPLAILHSISSCNAVKSVCVYKDGAEMNVVSMYRYRRMEPQDILLNIMPPREVSLVKYLSERGGIKCEPEFTQLYGEFTPEQVDNIMTKASSIFKGFNDKFKVNGG